MKNLQLKVSLFINYFVFAVLLNSVGTVILQIQGNFDITKSDASVLEGFKDLSIAIMSFLVASYVVRIGYKRSMLIALALVTSVCFLMPSLPSFVMVKLLFATVGMSFALIKVSVFATLGLVAKDEKEHLSLMNFLESFFMIGVLSGNFLFSLYIDNNDPKSTAWFNIYYLLAGLSAAAFLLLFTAKLDETSIIKTENVQTQSLADDFVAMLRLTALPLVLVFIGSAFFYVLIEQSIMSWLPTLNKETFKLSTSLAVQMSSILSLSIAVGRFFAGFLLKKLDWLYVLVGCIIAAGAIVFITVPMMQNVPNTPVNTLQDVPLVAFAFPLIGLFLAPIYPAINSIILSNVPKQKHAALSGLIVVFSALGGTTGSRITGHIFDEYGVFTALRSSFFPMIVLITLLYFFKKMQKKMSDN